MGRPRSPNRDKAFEIYKKYNGDITLREISNMLNEKEKTISNWKCRDKWDIKINCSTTKNECSTTKGEKSTKIKKKEPIAEEVKELLENTELTDKQRLFCIYYVKYWNATKAALKSGYSKYTAYSIGHNLLKKVEIKNEINKRKQEIRENTGIEAMAVFQKYIDIAFADILDYLTFGQNELPVLNPITGEQITDDDGKIVTYTINYVDFKESSEVDGTLISEVSKGKAGIKVKLQDKIRALDWLADHMDLLDTATKEKLKIEKDKLEIARLNAKNPDDDEVEDDGFIEAMKGTVEEVWSDEDTEKD